MKTPPGLQPLIDEGVIDEVVRSLKSGKEATVYVVRSGAQMRCAKVYRNMAQRSFQKRAQYQEGRKVRGSRQTRAISKSTRFGRKEQEVAWKNAEVDALYQLVAAGVRVPRPHGYFRRRADHGTADRCLRRTCSATRGAATLSRDRA
jgi:RIO kinase 1